MRLVLAATALLWVTVSPFAFAPNFISKQIDEYVEKNGSDIRTRFPPEPNGYLHLGHAKSITFNFDVASQYENGLCNMRLDDTNPSKEGQEYVDSILEDVRWLRSSSSPWDGDVRLTSNYFDVIYDCAVALIESGDAYVEELSAEEMREYRGTLTEPGKDSPYRNRPVEESLKLFQEMKEGKHEEGSMVLRAKIDMSSPNINMRDPTLFRIKHESHQNTGDKWCIYPMYDFSHPISDSLESITHSLCTLEFEDHRPLYDWTVEKLLPTKLIPAKPQQIEFSRLNLQYTVLSKRKLIQLVEENHVNGWDDPRMPTISGVRRRGLQPAALKLFCERMGISKSDSFIDYGILEDCVRETMDKTSPRAFSILEPLKVTIKNWKGSTIEDFEVPRHPKDEEMGMRNLPFGKTLYIERSDFFDVDGPEGKNLGGIPPKGFKRLLPDGQVRLKFAYVIQCEEVVRDPDTNEPIELICTYDDRTAGGVTPEGEKRVKGIIQWLEANSAAKCTIREYDRLFKVQEPGQETGNFLDDINPQSVVEKEGCLVESSVGLDALGVMAQMRQGSSDDQSTAAGRYHSDLSYQFERAGYFALDKDSTVSNLIFNRVVTLRDTWAAPKQEAAVRNRGGNKQQQEQQSNSKKKTNNNGQPAEDICRVALRKSTIKSVSAHPESDKLLVCQVSCGDEGDVTRTVVAGLASKFDPEDLVDREVICLTNLKPARLAGIDSTAMILASESETDFALLTPPEGLPDGELITFAGYEECANPDPLLKSKGAVKVWERVQQGLSGNADGTAVYTKDGKECLLQSSKGPIGAVAQSTIR